MQSLPQLNTDAPARREAASNWGDFKNQRDGDKAVAGARYGLALKSAQAAPTAMADGMVEANRALGVNPATVSPPAAAAGAVTATTAPKPAQTADEGKLRLAQYSNQGRLVAGKNFFQNTSNQWVDSAAQQLQNAKKQRIQFNSTEYFAFAAKERRALPWLALGANVQFVLDETLYEIYE